MAGRWWHGHTCVWGSRACLRRLQLAPQGLEAKIRDLRVFRDVYYTQPIAARLNSVVGKPVRLGEEEYFVLGDNSPISDDSRNWPERGAVRC